MVFVDRYENYASGLVETYTIFDILIMRAHSHLLITDRWHSYELSIPNLNTTS